MGTTLTGTTPQDTYDSLIKVTDNGPLSGTAKYLSDGLGNDSALALSTGDIGIGTTSPSRNLHILGGAGIGTVLKLEAGSGAITYLQLAYNGATNAQSGYIGYDSSANMGLFTNDAERMLIDSSGKVGIGTSTPATTLHVSDAASTTATFNSTFGQLAISFANSGTTFAQIGSGIAVTPTGSATDLGFGTAGSASRNIVFATGASFLERLRIDSTGNVGIGTNAPAAKLEVAGTSANTDFRISRTVDNTAYAYITAPGGATLTSVIGISGTDIFSFDTNKYIRFAAASGGIQFNGDTAAANALDDYEEGTFTPTYASGLTGVTYTNTSGKYTKIGRAVHWSCRIQATAATADSNQLTLGGFPFTSGAAPETSGSIGYFSVYTTDVVYMYNNASSTTIPAFYKKDATLLIGTDLTSVIGVIHCSGTYFV